MLLQQRPDLKGSVSITCIDDEPFPNVIKKVPSMIVGDEIWDCDKIFSELSNIFMENYFSVQGDGFDLM